MKMGATLASAAAYFVLVFIPAFAVGAFRSMVVTPRLGATIAVLLETPLILVVSWFAAGWCIDRFGVGGSAFERLTMGLAAFVLLMSAEFSLAIFAFGQSATGYVSAIGSLPGLIGLAAQAGFALIPLARTCRDRANAYRP
jgi:hypothetical protein